MSILLFAAETDKFRFRMQTDKSVAYLGEPIKITFIFEYPIDTQIAEANFAPPTFHDFWIKPGKDVPDTIKNGYHTYRLDYTVTPQKAGVLEIEPARMDVGIMQSKKRNTLRFDRVRWKSFFSNALKIDVKPLPDNISLFGTYRISAEVDKNRTKADEPVNLTVRVIGAGNMEDIEDFVISSDIAAVYADKAKRRTEVEKGIGHTTLEQKFAFIAERNFTIPSLSLTYFDSREKRVKTIKTDPIAIEVVGNPQKRSQTRLEKRNAPFTLPQSGGVKLWILTLLGGFAAGILATIVWIRMKRSSRKGAVYPIEVKIKKAKNDKELLALLLPYGGKSPKLDKIIQQLEKNLYEGGKSKIDRASLSKNFSKYVTITPNEAEFLL